jgi:transposase
MIKRQEDMRGSVELVNIDHLMPSGHPLRRLDSAVRWGEIYEMTDSFYSPDKGRPYADPVVLVKIVLLKYIMGMPSLRRTLREAETSIAYRWFLGYNLSARIPHYSTVRRNLAHRINGELFERIFTKVLTQAAEGGCISPEAVLIHKKPGIVRKEELLSAIPEAVKAYARMLHAEIGSV